jgi:hypothetical protein
MEQSGFSSAALAEQLQERCEAAEIGIEIDDDFFGSYAVTLEMPAGRGTRSVFAVGSEGLTNLLQVPFEKYVFLGQLWAICSYSDDLIEALVTTPNGANPRTMVAKRLDADPEDLATPMFSRSNGNISLELGSTSPILQVLTHRSDEWVVLKVRGLGVGTHDAALDRIKALADSLFFEIDTILGSPLILARERGAWLAGRMTGSPEGIGFPQSEYDPDPMALFWYGRGAARMPLLQFLAFYQVLEYYFPFYADQEVRRRVRTMVRHPQFNPHSETHISGLIGAAKSAAGGGFGDERSQLRAAVRGCTNPEAIREQIEPDGPRRYFEDRKRGVSGIVLKPDFADDELLDRVADRVYEIRCRIVHTKDSDARGRLLPFSPEAERLGPDIRLIEGIAREALVAHSKELKLHS